LGSSTTVANFTDSDTSDLASGFTATIDWGDGTTTPGTVVGANGSFAVEGGHTYRTEGSGAGTATITRTSDHAHIAPSGTMVEGELAGSEVLTATEGTALPNDTLVASFLDDNFSDLASNFTATIDWGDGTTTPGTVVGSNGSFAVEGGHTY